MFCIWSPNSTKMTKKVIVFQIVILSHFILVKQHSWYFLWHQKQNNSGFWHERYFHILIINRTLRYPILEIINESPGISKFWIYILLSKFNCSLITVEYLLYIMLKCICHIRHWVCPYWIPCRDEHLHSVLLLLLRLFTNWQT